VADWLAGALIAVAIGCLVIDAAFFAGRRLGRPPGAWRVSFVEIGLFFWSVLVVSLLSYGAVGALAGGLGWGEPLATSLGILVNQLCWLVFALAFLSYFPGRASSTFSWQPEIGWPRAVVYGLFFALASLPLIALVQAVWRWVLSNVAGHELREQMIVELVREADSPVMLALMVVSVVGLAPVSEELIFRRGIFRYLLQHLSPGTSAWLSGLLFGLIHMEIAAIVPIAVLGYLFARAYHKTGRLLVPILMHAIFNGLSVVVQRFAPAN
jgi:membrane protease YdiL (CAAX protease family)